MTINNWEISNHLVRSPNGEDYMAKSHPGFKGVQKKIESEGYSKKAAGAILASKSRGASKSAKKKNPNFKRVK